MKRFFRYQLFTVTLVIAMIGSKLVFADDLTGKDQLKNRSIPIGDIRFHFDESGKKSVRDLLKITFSDTLPGRRTLTTRHSAYGSWWIRMEPQWMKDTEEEMAFFAGQHRITELYCIQRNGSIRKYIGGDARWEGHILMNSLVTFRIDADKDVLILIKITPFRYQQNRINPMLFFASTLNPDILVASETALIISNRWFNLLTYGAMAMILVFFIFKYVVLRTVEYPAYIAYISCLLTNGINEWIMTTGKGSVFVDIKHIFYVTLSLLTYYFYLLFSSKLLNIKERLPGTFRLIRTMMKGILIYAAVDLICFYVFHLYGFTAVVFEIIRILILLISIVLVFKAYRLQDRVSRFFVTGSSFYIIGGMLYMVFFYLQLRTDLADSIWTYPPFHYRMGAIVEILFFAMGLAYKTHLSERERYKLETKLAQEKKQREADLEVARQETIEIERNRLSRDLHDEVGMGLTRIRYLLELLKRNQQDVRDLEIEPIAQESNRVIQTMHDIVWSLKTGEHSFEEFLANMRGTVVEYLETYGILLKFEVTGDLKSVELSPLQKRNILLIVRECLHNVIRHSRATEVKVEMRIHGGLSLYISDNGIGAGPSMNQGNGVANMRRRMEECGGSFEWKNNFENGVSVIAEIRNSKA